MIFNNNIKVLRKRRGRTQDDVAFALEMKRPTLSGYENGVAQPNMDALIKFSEYYGVAIDTLIKVELGALPESQFLQLERGYDTFIKGSKLRVLATTVGEDNEENIELAPSLKTEQPEQQAQNNEQVEQLLTAIKNLPNDQRDTFLLYEEAGLSIDEIAQTTGVSFEAAKSRLSYAMNKLRDDMKVLL